MRKDYEYGEINCSTDGQRKRQVAALDNQCNVYHLFIIIRKRSVTSHHITIHKRKPSQALKPKLEPVENMCSMLPVYQTQLHQARFIYLSGSIHHHRGGKQAASTGIISSTLSFHNALSIKWRAIILEKRHTPNHNKQANVGIQACILSSSTVVVVAIYSISISISIPFHAFMFYVNARLLPFQPILFHECHICHAMPCQPSIPSHYCVAFSKIESMTFFLRALAQFDENKHACCGRGIRIGKGCRDDSCRRGEVEVLVDRSTEARSGVFLLFAVAERKRKR